MITNTPISVYTFLLVTTIPFIVVYLYILIASAKRKRSPPTVAEALWLLSVAALWLAVNVASFCWIPGDVGKSHGEVNATLYVTAYMWGFQLSSAEVKSGYITFVATSRDTMHSMGIYDENGRLLATVMLMPGHKEVVTLYLPPGVYTLRCLEYCGDGHAFMMARLNVRP